MLLYIEHVLMLRNRRGARVGGLAYSHIMINHMPGPRRCCHKQKCLIEMTWAAPGAALSVYLTQTPDSFVWAATLNFSTRR